MGTEVGSTGIKIDLTEYNRLKELLKRHSVPFEEHVREFMMGYPHYQLVYPSDGSERLSDAVIGYGTYGWQDGLLEQMGLLPDCLEEDVQGWLDADTIFERWAEDFGFFVKGMEKD